MNQSASELGDQLRAAIQSSGESQRAICRAAGIETAVLSRFMHGKGWFSEQSCNALCRHLGLILVFDPTRMPGDAKPGKSSKGRKRTKGE